MITAASRGIGAACARTLAARGYRVALLARSEDVHSLATELSGIAVQGSVASEADLRHLVETALAQFGSIDAVVNNTGHVAKGDLLDLSDQDWHDGVDLLLLNVVRMARLVTPVMLNRGGAIVNISSFAARQPGLRFPISATLRAALGNFVKLYSERYAANQIRMNNVLPGWIDSHAVDEESRQSIPAGRAGTPEEVAAAVAFLVSDDARYIAGESLLVDGGLVRGA
jgi:NAD(P)-dependent dehydrogenase (short-subunit alcohol dehydrogenase family)